MDVQTVTKELTEFITLASSLTHGVLPGAKTTLRPIRVEDVVCEVGSERNRVPRIACDKESTMNEIYPKVKRPLTAAERTRAYRQRKRLLKRELLANGVITKKRPYTSAERTRRYRERKKAAMMLNNSSQNILNAKWVFHANAWDGVVIVPDAVPTTSSAVQKSTALCPMKRNDTNAAKPFQLIDKRVVGNSTSNTNPNPILECDKDAASKDKGGAGAANAAQCKAIRNARAIEESSVIFRYEPTRPCPIFKNDATKNNRCPPVEPITTILLNDEPPPDIKGEPLESVDGEEDCDMLADCAAGECTGENVFVASNSVIDANYESPKLEVVNCFVPTAKLVVFDTAEASAELENSSSSSPTAASAQVPEESVVEPVIIRIVQKNATDKCGGSVSKDRSSATSANSTCDLCKRSCFSSDLLPLPKKHIPLLRSRFPSQNLQHYSACNACRKMLNENGIPLISQSHGNEDPLAVFFCNSLWQT